MDAPSGEKQMGNPNKKCGILSAWPAQCFVKD